MKYLMQSLVFFFILTSQGYTAEPYAPNSGDKALDEYLITIDNNINRKTRAKLSEFVDKVAQQFQVPVEKVEALFNHYEFKAPDVIMSVSIADVSGQPLQNVAGTYFKNKAKGWKYTLDLMNVRKGSKIYKQIKKDAAAEY